MLDNLTEHKQAPAPTKIFLYVYTRLLFVTFFVTVVGVLGAMAALLVGSHAYLHWAAQYPAAHARLVHYVWIDRVAVLGVTLGIWHITRLFLKSVKKMHDSLRKITS
jgi:hypothetical protein